MTATPAPTHDIRDGILAALDLQVPRPRLSATYRLGVFLVAAVMVLLPLIYLALIGAAAFGIYYHATENFVMLEGRGSRRGAMFIYLTPLVVGVVLLFFMVKPLLAPRRSHSQQVEVDRARQPFLYQFVEALCAAVGAPAPRRILLDCEPNASAGFHQGGLGLASSGRELTLGLPLVAAMSVRQVAGILAHEFGHFSQGMAMRFSFLVQAINGWFARVVFERDDWDEKLVQWSKSDVGYLSIPAFLARGCVWSTRRILYGLMWVGHAVSSHMSRQMEYDADTFEIQLAGSEAFASSMRQVIELSTARSAAIRDLEEVWELHQIADDFPRLVTARFSAITPEIRERIRDNLAAEPKSTFASHPRPIDRIDVAERAATAGVFKIEEPATVLFDGFAEVCRDASRTHYQNLLGDNFRADYLVDTEAFVGDRQRAEVEQAAAYRFFQGTSSFVFALSMPHLDTDQGDATSATVDHAAMRQACVAAAPDIVRALHERVARRDDRIRAALARMWIEVGVDIDPPSFGLFEATSQAAIERHESLTESLETNARTLHEATEPFANRLRALAVGAGAESAELRSLLSATTRVGRTIPNVLELRTGLTVLSAIFEHEAEESQQDDLNSAVAARTQQLRKSLEAIVEQLGETAYPFPHTEGEVSLRHVAVPELPADDHVQQVFEAAAKADSVLADLYLRLLGRIASLGEAIETAAGHQPLPEPAASDRAATQD